MRAVGRPCKREDTHEGDRTQEEGMLWGRRRERGRGGGGRKHTLIPNKARALERHVGSRGEGFRDCSLPG